MTVNWRTGSGSMDAVVSKVGPVSRTLMSVDRLRETGHDVIFTKNRPHSVNMKTGEITSLRKDGGMFIIDEWIWVPMSLLKRRKLLGLHGTGKSYKLRLRTSAFRCCRSVGR